MDEILEMRKRLRERLEQVKHRLEKIDLDRRRESNSLDEDWEEQATIRQNDEVLDGLEEEGQVAAIRLALERMDEGAYGICSECGKSILKARLEALPYATLCIKCTEEQEAGA